MPLFEVQGPDGKVYEAEAASPAEAAAAIKKMTSAKPSVLESIGTGAVSGLSLGFDDELAAGLKTGFGFAGDYQKELAWQREQQRKAREAHPNVATIGEIGGMLVPGIGAIKGGLSLVPHVTSKSLPTKIGAGLVEGAGWGAAYGAGTGETGEKSESALRGGITGAVVGAAAPPVAAGIGKAAKWGVQGWQRFTDWLRGMPKDQRIAATRVLKDLEASGMSVDDATQRVADLGPEGMVADISPTMQQRTGKIAASEPAASRTITESLKGRREAGQGRVGQALDDAFGPYTDRYEVELATKAEKALASPLYEAAKKNMIDTTDVIDNLTTAAKDYKNPAFLRHLSAARRMLPKRGEQVPAGDLHAVREYLDDAISKAHRAGESKLAGRLQGMRTMTDAKLKAIGYADPDAIYAEASKRLDDFQFGRKELLRGGADTPTPAMLDVRLQKRPGSEKDITQGARSEIERQLSNVRRNPALTAENVLTRDFNDEKVGRLVGAPRAEQLAKSLDREKTFLETSNIAEAGRGSRTALIQGPKPLSKDLTDVALTTGGGAAFGGPSGAAVGFGVGLVKRLTERGLDKLAARTERAINLAQGEMLTATGAKRHVVMRELSRVAGQLHKAGEVEAAAKLLSFAAITQQGHRAEPLMPLGGPR